MQKLKDFDFDGQKLSITYFDTNLVAEGVEADLYSFPDDNSKDLAIVRVLPHHRTPLQKVIKGQETIEGYVDGEGILTIHKKSGEAIEYVFGPSEVNKPVSVTIGDTMQWLTDTGLTFYEVCSPPYEDGRFENL